jgi:hypothetical protein
MTEAPFASMLTNEINAAICAAMKEFTPPAKTKDVAQKGTTRAGREYTINYKYAPLDDIVTALRQPLTNNGLWFRQFVVVDPSGTATQRTIVYHSSGQWIGSDFPIFASKEGAQGFASGSTYARRYGLELALGIQCSDDDDDANSADGQQARIGSRPEATVGSTSGRAGAVPLKPDSVPLNPSNELRDTRVAAFRRIRKAIVSAPTIAELNRTGATGISNQLTMDDLKVGAPDGWQALMDEDSERRMELILPDDPVDDIGRPTAGEMA